MGSVGAKACPYALGFWYSLLRERMLTLDTSECDIKPKKNLTNPLPFQHRTHRWTRIQVCLLARNPRVVVLESDYAGRELRDISFLRRTR